MRQLRTTANFKRRYSRLPVWLRREANDVAQQLRVTPLEGSLSIKQLEEVPGNLYRVTLGNDYRLIYSFTKTTVLLHHVGHRSDVYETL